MNISIEEADIDSLDFINRHYLTKRDFRLPTKREWKYAAFGVHLSHGYSYSGSNNPNEVAWYKEDLQGGIH